jgi:protein TonB
VKIPSVASPPIYTLPTLADPEDSYAPKIIYPPILVKRVEPIYPPVALKKKMEGDVEVDIDIGKGGSVDHVRAWLGNPVFIDAATTAVKQWKYNPYVENGKAEKVNTSITIKFRLPKKSRK